MPRIVAYTYANGNAFGLPHPAFNATATIGIIEQPTAPTGLSTYVLTLPAQSTDGGLLPLSSPTTLLGAGLDDDSSASTAIGFTFNMDAVACTHFVANANGWASLSGSLPSSLYDNAELLGVGAHGPMVAPWWDDLRTTITTGYVKTELQGVAPNRVRVIEWSCYGNYGQNVSNHDVLTFQACLHEHGSIVFRYGPFVTTGSPTRTGYSASCGVRGSVVAGVVNGHVWDFFGVNGSPAGTSAPGVTNLSSAPSGNKWPGDSGHTGSPSGAYNIHLTPAYAAETTTWVRPTVPKPFYDPTEPDQLAAWNTAMDAYTPAGHYAVSYSTTAKRVTVSTTNYTPFRLVFAELPGPTWTGFLSGLGGAGSYAYSWTASDAPAAACELLGVTVEPAEDAARVDLHEYRHGRAVAVAWGNHQIHKVTLYLKSEDLRVLDPGYLVTGRVRITQGTDATAYGPTNPGGVVDGYVIASTDPVEDGDLGEVWTVNLLVGVTR